MQLHTKNDFQNIMLKMLNPLENMYSEGGARLKLGGAGATYDQSAIELEAFSRPLWGLVPFWVGGGRHAGFEEIYAKGLANGATPESEEYWGGFKDYDQRFVEMAAIATGLIFAPQVLWQPLAETEKDNLCTWLNGINNYVIPSCNWHFFRVLVNVAFKKLGREYSEEKLAQSLAAVDEYYMGDGWYQDGASAQKDYYVPFALHYYGLVYAVAMEREDPKASGEYKRRAAKFAGDFLLWFSEDGSALPYGRSLTYRFAQVSFWSACLFAGVDAVPADVVKGLITRHLEYWLKQEIAGDNGVLTVGYAYPNLIMGERYNAPGSPYWAMKTFLFLALPDEHPFWAAEAAPLPQYNAVTPMPRADMLIHKYQKQTVAYPAGVCELYGHGHLIEKYSKFAYSTRYGFSVATSQLTLEENAPDNMLAFVPRGGYIYVRKNSISYEVRENAVISQWSPMDGINVTTTITPLKNGHKRQHVVKSSFACTAYDCGFSVPKFGEDAEFGADDEMAKAKCGCLAATVSGKGAGAQHGVLEVNPNTNILFKNTVLPYVKYEIAEGKTELETVVETIETK